MEQQQTIRQLVDGAERIGVIGSPSSTSQLTLDILGTAVNRKLVGELSLFRFAQDGQQHYTLGQITEIELRNVWMEDPTMRSLTRQKGRVDPVTEKQDTHLGKMTTSAIFRHGTDGFEPSILGTVPPTGTPIHIVNDEILDNLLARYLREIFYLGHVYGSTPKFPLWFKHFGSGPSGAGEAYHLGIFGKTGSGKSVLAKMILLGYARHPEMAIFVIDPQGEFSKDMRGETLIGEFQLPMNRVLQNLNKQVRIYSVRDLVLDRWDLFQHILAGAGFLERLGIHTSDKRELASQILRENLERRNVRLQDLYRQEAFNTAWAILQEERPLIQIYSGRERRQELIEMVQSTDCNEHYNNYWLPIARLFQTDRAGAVTVDRLLREVFGEEASRPVVVVNLSREGAGDLYWNDTIQALVMNRLLDGIIFQAERGFLERNVTLNTLVMIDEARRLASREREQRDEINLVREKLADASLSTRKYGLGWMFISQSPLNLQRDIINQLRIYFFGFGLALGSEFQALKEIAGGDPNSLKLYQSFRDPHSAFDSRFRQYPFMTVGPVSPLSFAGTPLFLTAFNTPEEFLQANRFRA